MTSSRRKEKQKTSFEKGTVSDKQTEIKSRKMRERETETETEREGGRERGQVHSSKTFCPACIV